MGEPASIYSGKYSNKYYDPEKAHDYYMKNRELKGYENRYGGSRGDGTSAASTSGYKSDYQKENENVQNKIYTSNSEYSNKIDKLKYSATASKDKATIEVQKIQNEINTLQASLSGMSREDRAANGDAIKEEISELRDRLKEIKQKQKSENETYKKQLRELQLQQSDEEQRLKQQIKGGSTSGFNKAGKRAAERIKKNMESEKEKAISSINKDLDSKMLSKVNNLANQIKKLRESGQKIDNKQFLAKTKSILGEIKKEKIKLANQKKEEYKQKYKDEIDKLRSDDSMFTYWDNRKKKVEAQKRADELKAQIEAIKNQSSNNESSDSSGSPIYSGKIKGTTKGLKYHPIFTK